MEAGQQDRDTAVHELIEDQLASGNSLQRLFFADDVDNNERQISFEMFDNRLNHCKNMKEYLTALDIDYTEARTLFEQLDVSGDGVSVEELQEGLMKVKGLARSIDMVCIGHECDTFAGQFRVFMS